jgi:flagellar biosynthesis protein FlhA
MPPSHTTFGRLFRYGDLWLVFGVLGTVLLLILPIPPFLLDMLLALSIAISMLTLLVILYLKEPSEFSGFPVLLLFLTLFRLALNVASTRLILLDGYAGHVIEAFGSFVVRGNYVVGLVVFLILVLINFIVITKGAGRIAEVAARFTLDALPGKQMSIDAELNAGLIKEDEARARRRHVEQEADFYGAMDGASKFVRGDAVAAVLITIINVLGGFGVGILQKGMTMGEAIQRFTLLSIGDGLASQVPALVTSMAAGILITRVSSKNDLGQDLSKQLLSYPRAITVLSGTLFLMALLPGLPTMPFLILALITGGLAYTIKKYGVATADPSAEAAGTSSKTAATTKKPGASSPATTPSGEKLEELLSLDTLVVELGYSLVGLADPHKGGDLRERVTSLRRTFAQEMGVLVPPVRLRDNLQLGPEEYRFLFRGDLIASGQVMPNHSLAMNVTNSKTTLKGVPTVEPVFQLPATWITESERKNAELAGYTVVDTVSVLVTHLSETVKRHAHLILTRQDVQALLDNLKQTHPTVINELIPSQLTVGHVQRILQNLLAEGLSIRNLAGILEKVSDYVTTTKNPDELSEHARRALGAQITRNYQGEDGRLHAITLDPRLEQQIAKGMSTSPGEVGLVLEPGLARHVMDQMGKCVQQMVAAGHAPVVVCAPQIRLAFHRFFETAFAELAVLSYAELPARVQVQNAGMIPCPQ